MWAQLRVWRCSCGRPHADVGEDELDSFLLHHVGEAKPAELLPHVYGGLYDRLHREYVPGARPKRGQVQEIDVHPGQLRAILHDKPLCRRLMILGGPGSGKTRTLSIATLLDALELPNRVQGYAAATRERLEEPCWKDFLDLVEPLGWVENKTEGRHLDALLVNGHTVQFRAAKEPSKLMGSPIQGKNWDRGKIDETQSVHDRVQADIDERGRRAGKRYKVLETATNFGLGHFVNRIEKYKSDPFCDIIRLNPLDNPFIETQYWLRFRGFYSKADWARRILAQDVPPDQLAYAGFSYKETIRPRPRDPLLDVTRQITRDKFGECPNGVDWVVGTDWGVLATVSIWLKAFRAPNSGDILWWACHEITSGSHSHAGHHAKRLLGFANPSDFIVLADPGINTKDPDKSDYELSRREGIKVRPAWHEPIRVTSRWKMMNALLEDSSGKRRFFIDCDHQRTPACPKLVQSFLTQTLDERGNPENVRKDYSDPTHWPAAAQYGVYIWERLRGHSTFEIVTGQHEDPILARAAAIAARRGN